MLIRLTNESRDARSGLIFTLNLVVNRVSFAPFSPTESTR